VIPCPPAPGAHGDNDRTAHTQHFLRFLLLDDKSIQVLFDLTRLIIKF
jgi:hypothetical protein